MANPVQAYFDSEANRYSKLFDERKSGRNVLFRTRLALVRELARGARGAMLDCATGTGEISAEVFANGNFDSVTLVDISEEMLGRAKARIGEHAPNMEVQFLKADIFEFLESAKKECCFDLILCVGLIAHTGRVAKLLNNVHHRLAKGGRLLLQTSLLDHPGNRIWRLLMHNRAARRQGYEYFYYLDADIRAACREARLSVLDARKYGVGFPFLEKMSPRINYLFELKFRNWAQKYGCEVIYVLTRSDREDH